MISGKVQNSQNVAVAIDIGTTKICVIAGQLDEFGRLEVIALGTVKSEGVSRGVVTNIDKTVKGIQEAVEQAEVAAGFKFRIVHVGIAGQHIKSLHNLGRLTRVNYNSEITKDDIDKLIKDMYRIPLPAGDKILHVIPQEFTVDEEKNIADPIGMAGYRLEGNFHIITGQITASKNIIRCIEKASMEVADLTLEPIASSSSILTNEEKEAGVVLVDIGGGTSDITIFKEGIIRHTAVIPFGGNIITDDIKEGCSVLADQAEKLKVKFGCALADEVVNNRKIVIPGLKGREPKSISEKSLAQIIQARVEEIFDYVMFEVKRSGFERKAHAGIVLTGGGSLLNHIDSLVQMHTGMHARVGVPTDHLAHGYNKELASPIYATAVGLLKYALENELNQYHINISDYEDKGMMSSDATSHSFSGNRQNDVVEKTKYETEGEESNEDNGSDKPKAKKDYFNNFFNKLSTYTKDFLDPAPDHEL
jgi:cell division protein FtsA